MEDTGLMFLLLAKRKRWRRRKDKNGGFRKTNRTETVKSITTFGTYLEITSSRDWSGLIGTRKEWNCGWGIEKYKEWLNDQ